MQHIKIIERNNLWILWSHIAESKTDKNLFFYPFYIRAINQKSSFDISGSKYVSRV